MELLPNSKRILKEVSLLERKIKEIKRRALADMVKARPFSTAGVVLVAVQDMNEIGELTAVTAVATDENNGNVGN